MGRVERGRAVFWFGLLVFSMLQGSLVLYPAFVQPRFPVDSYGYIAKAEQMRGCFRQDCRALVDLRQQTVPTGDRTVDWERNRAYHRGLYIYHPLHSAVLVGLRTVLPSWEAAWLTMTIAGEVILISAIAWFTAAVWSPMAAGIGLLALAPTLYAGYHGLHVIVPGTLALSLALLTWAQILARTWTGRILTPIFIVAMLTMHAVGVVFAGITLLLYLAIMNRRAATTWIILGAGAVLIVAHSLLPHLIDAPALTHWQHPPPEGWTFWPALRESLGEVLAIVDDWSTPFGGPAGAGLLVMVGLMCAPDWRSTRRLLTGAVLLASVLASAFYVLPRYPAELFSRVWIPLALFATTAIAWSWLVWLRAGGSVYAQLRSRASRPACLAALRQDYGRPALGFLALGALTFTGLGYTGAMYAGFYPYLSKNVSDVRGGLPVEPAQPAQVLQHLEKGEAILYMDEFPMYFYFSHGALDHPAIYFPGFRHIDEQPPGLTNTGMVVAMRAGDQYKEALNDPDVPSISGGFPLQDGTSVLLRARDPGTWLPAQIKVDNADSDTTLLIEPSGQREGWEVAVPADWQGWLPLVPAGQTPSRELRIRPAAGTGALLIGGLRTGGASSLDWPWDRGVSAVYEYTAGRSEAAEPETGTGGDAAGRTPSEIVVAFDSQALIPDTCESQGVVDDRGSMTAIRARCGRD